MMMILKRPVRDLAERWKSEGCKEFDEADNPVEVAEAARQLRCAMQLSQLVDRLEDRSVNAPFA